MSQYFKGEEALKSIAASHSFRRFKFYGGPLLVSANTSFSSHANVVQFIYKFDSETQRAENAFQDEKDTERSARRGSRSLAFSPTFHHYHRPKLLFVSLSSFKD